MPRRPEKGIKEDRYRARGQNPAEYDRSTFRRMRGKTALKRGMVASKEDARLAGRKGATVLVGRRWDDMGTGPRGGSPYTVQSVRVPVSKAERKRREKAAREEQATRRKLSEEERKRQAAARREEQRLNREERARKRREGLRIAEQKQREVKQQQEQEKQRREEAKRIEKERKKREKQAKKQQKHREW